jgi:hypothetical protein
VQVYNIKNERKTEKEYTGRLRMLRKSDLNAKNIIAAIGVLSIQY